MTSRFDITALIETLKSLYSRIASLELKRRMDAYRKGDGAEPSHDIATALAEDIDKLAVSSDTGPGAAVSDTSSETGSTAAQHGSGTRRPVDRKHPQVAYRFMELIRFFKASNNASTMQPQLAEKLKASVWEHINTSLRLARAGEAASAKLHADVANNALKEAARYMPKEDYNAFYAQVEKQLREIRENAGSTPPSVQNRVSL